MDPDHVAQIFAKINLSPSPSSTLSSQELYTFADGKCAHCISTPEAYQVRYHQMSLLCQEVLEKGLSSDDTPIFMIDDCMHSFWGGHFNLANNDTVAVSFAMAADWVLTNDFDMARIAARNGLLLYCIICERPDGEFHKKWAQEEKKLQFERGLICWLKKKIPCPCLNEARRHARQNLPNTGKCMAPACGMILPKTELMKCSGCKISEYCSRDCQKTDW
jgi:hypothetical protein